MCASPVRTSAEGGGGSSLPAGKIAGVIGILLLHFYLFFNFGLMAMVMLCMAPSFAFMIAASQRARQDFRLLAGGFLVLALVGLWFASSNLYPNMGSMQPLVPPDIFQNPKLKGRLSPMFAAYKNKVMMPSFLFLRGPFVCSRLGARMLYWYVGMYLLYAVVILPPYLFLTPFWQRRRPWFSRTTCWTGLAVWVLVLAGLGTQAPKFPGWLQPQVVPRPLPFGPNLQPPAEPENETEVESEKG
jgi:hypothetical protein